MEAAGVIDDTRCLVIRGISDYADAHRPSMWRQYAAATVASFAREILCVIRPAFVRNVKPGNSDRNDRILALVKQAEDSAEPRPDHIAEDLGKARFYLQQALNSLNDPHFIGPDTIDPKTSLKVYFRSMTVECDSTTDTELSFQETWQHYRKAEKYEILAKKFADASGERHAPAQVKVEQSLVRGREAEIEDERGLDWGQVRRKKAGAVTDLENVMAELQRINLDVFREYDLRASKWRERLA